MKVYTVEHGGEVDSIYSNREAAEKRKKQLLENHAKWDNKFPLNVYIHEYVLDDRLVEEESGNE